jgi:hypothetical protein
VNRGIAIADTQPEWTAGAFMSLKRVGDLEIEEDMAFHRRLWFFERLGWGVILVVVIAALSGLFGSGISSSGSAATRGLEVDYDRFARYGADTTVRARFTLPDGQRQARIGVSTAFLERMRVEKVTPQPDSVEVGADQLFYVFAIAQGGPPSSVTFHLKPQRVGRASAQVTLGGEASVSFDQLVYP